MAAGVIVHIIEVLAFPPRDDCKILVSLESRKGMKLAKKVLLIKNYVRFLLTHTKMAKLNRLEACLDQYLKNN